MPGTDTKQPEKPAKQVHSVLAHSYLMYFFAVVAGLLLEITLPIKVIPQTVASSIGIVFLILAPLLIIWAQRSSVPRSLNDERSAKDFSKGPYAFSRTPTHLGLDLLIIGFGFLLNSVFIIIFSIISYVLTRFIFVRKQEKILGEKYGRDYHEYKKSVRAH